MSYFPVKMSKYAWILIFIWEATLHTILRQYIILYSYLYLECTAGDYFIGFKVKNLQHSYRAVKYTCFKDVKMS